MKNRVEGVELVELRYKGHKIGGEGESPEEERWFSSFCP